MEHAQRGLWNRRFVGLMLTQFAGATNDNILKAVLLLQVAGGGAWAGTLGKGGTGIVSLLLTVPFVLFLGWAGQLSDRVSKDRVIIATRILEVPIGLLAMVGFLRDDPWTVLLAFVLLASESAFFSPAKYGSIPEIVDESKVAEANGYVNMTTNVGILLGLIVGGLLASVSMTAVGIVIPCVAAFGLLSSLLMLGLKPMAPSLKRHLNPFGPYLDAIRLIRPGLVWNAVLAWGWFYGAAAVMVAVVPEYRVPLHLDERGTNGLLVSVMIGIGIGCVVAGRYARGSIRGPSVFWGGLGAGLVFCLLGVLGPAELDYWTLCGTLLLLGLCAGFFLIPLQAIQQLCTRAGERARILGTANALCFLLMTVTSAIYTAVVQFADLPPTRASFGCGILLFAVAGWIRFGKGRVILSARPGVPEAS